MMLFPQLYLLSGFAYGIPQNVYALDLPEENCVVLFDTGLDSADISVTSQTLKLWGLETRTISHVFLTHAHFDHSGNANFYESLGAVIYIGREDAQSLKEGLSGTISYAYAKPFPPCTAVSALDDGWEKELSAGIILRSIHVPGHTKGSMLYHVHMLHTDLVFTGDYIQSSPNCEDALLGVMVDESYSFDQYRTSLKKTLSLPCDLLLPGHGQPCLNHGYQLLQKGYRNLLTGRNSYR